MDGEDGQLAYKDAVFISTHKFVEGLEHPEYWWQNGTFRTQSLVSRRGTVSYVNSHEHRFTVIQFTVKRYPDIIGDLCGLVFQAQSRGI